MLQNTASNPTRSLPNSVGLSTLRTLSEQKIRFCIWKSVDRLEEGLRGETDLDLLVESSDESRLKEALKNLGWIELRAESWRDYDGVTNYITLDPLIKKFLHIHLHTKLVMGEERIKSLNLPIEQLYLDSAQIFQGVPCVNPALEFIVLLLRVPLKIKLEHKILSLLLRDKHTLVRRFDPEYKKLKLEFSEEDLSAFLKRAELAWLDAGVILSAYKDLLTYDADAREKIMRCIAPYRRVQGLSLFFEKFKRFIQRRTEGQGKRLMGRGKAFAFVGSDGSGKTSLAKNLKSKLQTFFKVRHFYLGGSPNSKGGVRFLVRIFIFPAFALIRRGVELVRGKGSTEALKQRYYDFEEKLIIAEKRSRYLKAQAAIERGEIVIFERFPVFSGYGDGIPAGKESDPDILARFKLFKTPDLIFGIDLSAQNAIQRKPEHEPKILEEKVAAFKRYFESSKGSKVLRVLNSDQEGLAALSEICLESIWKELSQ